MSVPSPDHKEVQCGVLWPGSDSDPQDTGSRDAWPNPRIDRIKTETPEVRLFFFFLKRHAETRTHTTSAVNGQEAKKGAFLDSSSGNLRSQTQELRLPPLPSLQSHIETELGSPNVSLVQLSLSKDYLCLQNSPLLLSTKP